MSGQVKVRLGPVSTMLCHVETTQVIARSGEIKVWSYQVRHLQFQVNVRTDHVRSKSFQVRWEGHVDSGQVRSSQCQFRSNQVRLRQVRSGHVRPCLDPVRTGMVKSGQFLVMFGQFR